MKLSIAWIFYHINANWKKIDINDLVNKFNKTTAEIESFKKVTTDISKLFIVTVKAVEHENVILNCAEFKNEIELPKRANIKKDDIYLVFKENDSIFRWARASDIGSDKDFLLPSFSISTDLIAGKWKDDFETEDYIIEVDNKSITHRPDLWGHRGFAREIAAILDLEFLPIEDYILTKTIKNYESKFNFDSRNLFSSSIDNPDLCKRFATFYINNIDSVPSVLPTLTRLARIDSKAINAIVDATNYVMFDMGQPMHAYDANKINGKVICSRLAKSGERLILLDDEIIELTEHDLVIADEKGPIALAGIMGGKNTEVDENTKSLLIESAWFDATTIRLSSIRHKKRTEASARFEKTLDPNQNTVAIERFLKILKFAFKNLDKNKNLELVESDEIISLGKEAQSKLISLEHSFIEKRLGASIDSNFIVKILEKIGFAVIKKNSVYDITVPTFRSTKDVVIPEDIVEEIGRFFGYDNIQFILPVKQMVPVNLDVINRVRKIKELMAYSCQMHEVQNYPFYDESYLNELKWHPEYENMIGVLSPVSENWKHLVTSLIPHLLKNVRQNLLISDQLNFFELNRIWSLNSKIRDNNLEEKSLAGIFFDSAKIVDFYESKALLSGLFDLLGISVKWIKPDSAFSPWYSKHQTAYLMFEEKRIGIAGKISNEFLANIVDVKCDAFIFELDADFLLEYNAEIIKFKPLPKYPVVRSDITINVPLNITSDQLIKIIKNANPKIVKVELIDIFVKEDWVNKKALTFRINIMDENKTLSKEEINNVMNNVNMSLSEYN